MPLRSAIVRGVSISEKGLHPNAAVQVDRVPTGATPVARPLRLARPSMKGEDVRALQAALNHAGFAKYAGWRIRNGHRSAAEAIPAQPEPYSGRRGGPSDASRGRGAAKSILYQTPRCVGRSAVPTLAVRDDPRAA